MARQAWGVARLLLMKSPRVRQIDLTQVNYLKIAAACSKVGWKVSGVLRLKGALCAGRVRSLWLLSEGRPSESRKPRIVMG